MPQNEKPNDVAVAFTNAVWCGLVFTFQNYETGGELSKGIKQSDYQDVNAHEAMCLQRQSGLKPFVDGPFTPG
jgi:hypothetical protein